MKMEIERKFIVSNKEEIYLLIETHPYRVDTFLLEQNYLYVDDKHEVRIRKQMDHSTKKEHCFLTSKSSGTIARTEEEIAITKAMYDGLSLLIKDKPIIKERIIFIDNRELFEVDFYRTHDLIILEIEFDSMESASAFNPASLAVELVEVTNDTNYKNKALWRTMNNI